MKVNERIESAINRELSRLHIVDALLFCLIVASTNDDRGRIDPAAVAKACRLILGRAIDGLDITSLNKQGDCNEHSESEPDQ